MTDATMEPRQTLIIQTVYFAELDRAAAVELGNKLYEALTRPASEPSDRLAFGPGIPVSVGASADRVDLRAAKHLLLVPVLGEGSFHEETIRRDVRARLAAWHEELRPGHVVPVFDAPVWLDEEVPGVPIRSRVLPGGDAEWTAAVIGVALAACRLVGDAGKPPEIFVSHAKRDLAATGRLAEQLTAYIRNHTGGTAFFDATSLESGHSLSAQLAEAVGRGVFVAVLGDSYASRPWCESEMLGAKRSGAPTLAVHVLQRGELRSYPYSGNGPTVVWTPGSGVEHIALRAIVEWLRYRHFVRDMEQRFRGDVPWLVPLPRPPELLDLAQGPLLERDAMVVMHPDPEVSRHEREVLRQARPRLRLVTPSTFYRGLELRSGGARCPTAPLSAREIALSVSDSPDAGGAAGFTAEHVADAVVFLCRALISAGAAVAYGGDLRFGGYDELLVDLIRTYNTSGQDRADYLISYQPATVERGAARKDLSLTVRYLRSTDGLRDAVRLPVPPALSPAALAQLLPTLSPDKRVEALVHSAVYLSDMRRLMSARCFARIVLGGQLHPRKDGATDGYRGAYPGVVEEAWWTFAAERPLYIAGGFGGAAGALAELFEGGLPALLQPGAFSGAEYGEHRQRAAGFEASPLRAQVEAPANLEDLARRLQLRAAQVLATDDTAKAWNGLSLDENRRLFRSRDRIEITQLVMRGLYRKSLASPAADKLSVELVRGDILRVEAADAIAIAAYNNVPIGGAAAAIDRAMSSQVTAALHQRRMVIPVPIPEIDADWLVIADLGELVAGDMARLPEAIERCAARVAEVVARNGFHKIAIVTFGSSVHGELGDVVGRMLSGFAGLRGACTVLWFERDKAVHDKLAALLGQRTDVELSHRALLDIEPAQPVAKPVVRDVVLTTRYASGMVHAMILPPEGAAVAVELKTPLDAAQFEAIAQPKSGSAPRATMNDVDGQAAVTAILGDHGRDMLQSLGGYRLVVQHDTETGMLPFEMFTIGGHRFSLEKGVVRRPVLSDVPLQTPRPVRRGALQLMLVVDPRLPEAVEEADAVESAIGASSNVMVRKLVGAEATRSAMLAALLDPAIDVFHHCGHAFYDGRDPAQSGLWCPSGERLTGQDIAGFDALPRIAFFNACRSARLRRLEPANPVPEGAGAPLESIYTRAFASFFLRGGVEAYVGTLWPVRDTAAALFAARVYTELSRGASLDVAMRIARGALRGAGQADWANYVLYGDGSFSIVK